MMELGSKLLHSQEHRQYL